MIDLALVVAMAVGSAVGEGSVQGTIRSEGEEPIGGVRVEIPSAGVVSWSDSIGRYAIAGLEPGDYEIRFERFAYDPLSLTVRVPARGAVRLDVALRTRFVLMPGIAVVAAGWRSGPPPSLQLDGLPEVGSREIPAALMWSSPLVPHPDAFEPLRLVPGIDMAEELPTQFHVRGGSADQNLILLDGAPVYNGTHASGVLAGILPDAVSRLLVHTGVFPARYGGRLSSVVAVETRTPSDRLRVRGGLGVPDLRVAVEAPLPRGAGGVLFGGRRTTYDLVGRGHFDRIESSGFEDAVGKGSIHLLGGRLEATGLSIDNWFSSAAGPEGAATGGADPHNTVRWSSATGVVSWRRSTPERPDVELRVWRSAARSAVEWGSLERRSRLDSRLAHWGLAGDVGWQTPTSVARLGLAWEALSSTYRTASRSAGGSGAPEPTPLFQGRPRVVSTYVEHRWIPRERWLISNGLRAIHVEGHGPELEPRLSAHYRPSDRLTLSAGFGRVHQYVQSLANEESLLNTAYAVEPLVAAGRHGVPVSRSDQWTAALDARLTPRLALTADAYTRWLDGIVLAAPATAQPFTTTGFESGEGRASGIGVALTYRGERASAEVLVESSSVWRRSGSETYRPRFERSRSLAAAAAWRVAHGTTLRSAFQVAAGLPTSPLAGGFEWEAYDQLTGEVEIAGTPLRAPGPINRDRLPSYVRLDLGIRKDWRYAGPGPQGSITTYVDVLNVLGHENVIGLQLPPAESDRRERLRLQPTSVLFGIEWSF